jgi:hypothetical protein
LLETPCCLARRPTALWEVVRPEAVVFLIALGVVVLVGVVSRLRRGPVDERRDHPFPYTPTVYGIVLAALSLVAAGIGRAVLLPGRLVARTRQRRPEHRG